MQFFLCHLVLLVVWFAVGLISYALPITIIYLVAFFIILMLFASSIILSIKRWHDRNLSGHVEWLFAGVPVLIMIFDYPAIRPDNYYLNACLSILAAVIVLWAFVELFFMPGTDGPNRYGPQPTISSKP